MRCHAGLCIGPIHVLPDNEIHFQTISHATYTTHIIHTLNSFIKKLFNIIAAPMWVRWQNIHYYALNGNEVYSNQFNYYIEFSNPIHLNPFELKSAQLD